MLGIAPLLFPLRVQRCLLFFLYASNPLLSCGCALRCHSIALILRSSERHLQRKGCAQIKTLLRGCSSLKLCFELCDFCLLPLRFVRVKPLTGHILEFCVLFCNLGLERHRVRLHVGHARLLKLAVELRDFRLQSPAQFHNGVKLRQVARSS